MIKATLNVLTKSNARTAWPRYVERGSWVGRNITHADRTSRPNLRCRERQAAAWDGLVGPIHVVFNRERFIKRTGNRAQTAITRRRDTEFMGFVCVLNLVLPISGRLIAIRRRAISAKIVVGCTGALIEDAVCRTRIVSVITLLRDVSREIGARVNQAEIADLTVQRPSGVGIIILAILRREQRGRQSRQRLVVIVISLDRKRAFGVETLVSLAHKQIPIRRDLPFQRDAATSIVDWVEVIFDERGVVVLTATGLLRRCQPITITIVGEVI